MRYNGPKTRHLERHTNDNFDVEGRVSYIEERPLFLQQTVRIEQTSTSQDNDVGAQWFEHSEEAQIRKPVGTVLPFSRKLEFERTPLVNTFTRMVFRPENCSNSTEQHPGLEARIAPFLTAKTIYNNVTRDPVVQTSVDKISYMTRQILADTVDAPLTLNGRLWFGFLGNHGAGDNSYTAPFENNSNLGDNTRKMAVGIVPYDMPHQINFDMNDFEDSPGRSGKLHFIKQSDGRFRSNRVVISVPIHKLFPEEHTPEEKILNYTIPMLYTHGDYEKHQQILISPTEKENENEPTAVSILNALRRKPTPDNYFNEVADANAVTAAEIKQREERAQENMIAVKIGTLNRTANGDPEDFYMFIPRFRVRSDSSTASAGRPKRLHIAGESQAARTANLHGSVYEDYGIPQVPDTIGHDTAHDWSRYMGNFVYNRDAHGWGYVHVGDINLVGGQHYIDFSTDLRLNTQAAESLVSATVNQKRGVTAFQERVKALIADIKLRYVDNRLLPIHGYTSYDTLAKELCFIYFDHDPLKPYTEPFQNDHKLSYMRIHPEQFNAYANDFDFLVAGNLGAAAINPPDAAGLAAQWNAHQRVQLELVDDMVESPNGGVGPLGAPDALTESQFQELPPLPAGYDALQDPGKVTALEKRIRSLYYRGSTRFVIRTTKLEGADLDVGAIAAGHQLRLWLPVRLDNTPEVDLIMYQDVTSVEPYFGYSSATTALRCDYPLDTAD